MASPEGPLVAGLRRTGDLFARAPRPAAALAAIGWACFLAWLSGGPPPEVPLSPFWSYTMNLGHAPLFAVFALLAALVLPREGERRWPRLDRRGVSTVLAVLAAYAVLDEWIQSRRPDRIASWTDVTTDLVGAGSTLVVAAYLARPSADGRGLALRLVVGSLACAAAAWNAAFGPLN